MPRPTRLILAVDSLDAGNGGICRVARLMARVLNERQAAGELQCRAIVLKDKQPAADISLPQTVCGGSKASFFARVQLAALRADGFVYDFVGMARAHCRLPGLRRPHLDWIHGIEVWPGHDWRPDRALWAARADLLLSNTAYTRDRAAKTDARMARAKVCWLATKTDDLPTMPPSTPDRPPTAVILGRLEGGYKGHRELFDAWPLVRQSVPNARLLVVGRGPDRDELEAAAGEGVEFLGFVPEADMPQLWADVDVLAMPSRGEGFGLVYIEAMRHGVPAIASVQDAAHEVNVDDVTGYNVDLDQPDAQNVLVDRLVRLLTDSSTAWRFGDAGRDHWQKHFRFSRFRERFNPLLDDFLTLCRP